MITGTEPRGTERRERSCPSAPPRRSPPRARCRPAGPAPRRAGRHGAGPSAAEPPPPLLLLLLLFLLLLRRLPPARRRSLPAAPIAERRCGVTCSAGSHRHAHGEPAPPRPAQPGPAQRAAGRCMAAAHLERARPARHTVCPWLRCTAAAEGMPHPSHRWEGDGASSGRAGNALGSVSCPSTGLGCYMEMTWLGPHPQGREAPAKHP